MNLLGMKCCWMLKEKRMSASKCLHDFVAETELTQNCFNLFNLYERDINNQSASLLIELDFH